MSYDRLRYLVDSDGSNLSPLQLLDLQRMIAGERFALASIVAQKKRAYLQAEVDRKSLQIAAKLRAKATNKEARPMSETAAADIAEQNPEVIRARTAEINAEMEFEEARLILSTSEGVLTSLVMRISDLKSERFHSAKVTHA